jgi:hypothetical protein
MSRFFATQQTFAYNGSEVNYKIAVTGQRGPPRTPSPGGLGEVVLDR